ncbi:MAG TPA: HAD-IIA family hydrolase [Solirubrobacteraceae bacterium]|nr:HAD-IIA family hydrolase [Solirubrobacteraceae bacterium]
MPLSPLLARYPSVILDLDGCVWVGSQATPRAAEAIAALRAGGRRIAFITNDAQHAPEEYVRKLWSLGCTASVEEVVSIGATLQHVLAGRPPARTFVIGAPAIFRHVRDAGSRIVNGTAAAESAELVVLAGHPGFDYTELRTAVRAVLGGAEILAGGRDATFPGEGGPWPGDGAILAALEYATGRTAVTVGKPEPQMFRTALDRLGMDGALVVGDRLDSDLRGAAGVGLDGAIVLTGVTSRAQAEDAIDPAPVAIAPDLGTLVLSS